MITREMLSILRCPVCFQEHLGARFDDEGTRADGTLCCSGCDSEFEVKSGIPDLVPHSRLESDEWAMWKDHLEGFHARRSIRQKAPSEKQHHRWTEKQKAFVEFIDIPDGRVLDVGCGPGKLRHSIDSEGVTYFGLDPLPTGEADSFPYVRALAEYIPYQDGAFSAMIVRSALDHFCELRTFFQEAARVLQPGGRLFIEQVIHEVRGPLSAAKTLAHTVKDFIDDLRTREERKDAPKHINEFSQERLVKSAAEFFDVDDVRTYDRNWYTPTQVLVALSRRG